MAQKQRLKVSLSAETFEVFKRLAELNDTSMSAVAGDLLESVSPAMRQTLVLMEAAQEASQETKTALMSVFDGLERELIGAAGGASAIVDHELSKHGLSTDPKPAAKGRKRKGRKAKGSGS